MISKENRMPIARVRIAECPMPLPYVLRLGPVEIRTRDYIAVRIETESGLAGEALGYPRGTPLFETVSQMARRVLGGDAAMRREVMGKPRAVQRSRTRSAHTRAEHPGYCAMGYRL